MLNSKKCWSKFTLIQMMLSIFVKESDGIIQAINTSGNEHCIMNAMRESFHQNSTVTIFLSNYPEYSQMESNLIENIFETINCRVVIYSTRMYHDRMSPLGVQRNFLIFLGDARLTATLKFLHLFYIWDSKAVFLVIVGNLRNQKEIIVETHRTLNESTSHVIVVEVFLNQSLQLFTENYVSMPSKEFTPNQIHEKLRWISSCKEVDGSVDSMKSTLHLKSGKELRVGAIHAPPFLFLSESTQSLYGSEVMLINTIAEKLGMTVNCHYYSNMDRLGNIFLSKTRGISGSGMVNDLLLNKIDIAIGNIVISDSGTENFAVSTPYTMDRLIWVLPVPTSISKSPISPFIYSLKLTLFFVCMMYWVYPLLAFMATNYFHKTSNDECSRYRTFHGTCLTFFAMSTGSNIDICPKTTRMRIFLFIWLFYTYHLNMYFASMLIRFFASEHDGQLLKTSDQLVGSEMQLGIDQRSFNYFTNYFNLHNQTISTLKNMGGKVIYCESTRRCLSRIVQNQNFSMTLSNNYFTYAKHLYVDSNRNFLLTPLPEAIVSVPIGIIAKKGFALQSKINVIILRINEAGLFNHWNDETIQLLKATRIFLEEEDNQGIDANYTLKYSDLSTVFLGIIFELTACCLVFLGELVVNRFKGRLRTLRTFIGQLVVRRFNGNAKPKPLSDDKAFFDYVN